MARGQANKLYRNFTAGLITEASPLTYPENACQDIDNCILYRKGNVSRRLGMNYEPNAELSTFTHSSTDEVFKEFVWEAVANRTDLSFLVLQSGTVVRFYDLNATPMSSGLKSFVIDMTTYLAPGATTAQAQDCELEFAAGKGYMWIVGERFEPILVTYDPSGDRISVTPIYILMRDFAGVNDGLANDAEPATLSTEHHYNLLNQGWVNPENTGAGSSQLAWDSFGSPTVQDAPGNSPITAFFASRSRYPGNNKQWWVARDSTTNAFDPELLDTFFYGSSRAPKGHYVLNAFYKDRGAVSGLGLLPVESTTARPTAVAFFSGRAWYICESSVYFSQVLDDKGKVGLCFQEADPTSEAISDLVATDGGVIPIPEMGKALRAFPAAGGLLIFANNGIWFVSGGAGGFSALDFSVIKVSSIGTKSPNSIIDTKRGIFWLDRVGLRSLTVKSGTAGPEFDLTTISEETIQTFVQVTIPASAKPYVKGVYDAHTNTIQWLFNSEVYGDRYTYNRILNLDLTLGSFYPFTINNDGPVVIGAHEQSVVNPINNPFNSSIKETALMYRTLVPSTPTTWRQTFSYFRDYTFVDWKAFDGTGFDYSSYLESGYELLDDAMRDKEQNYVFVYFRKTEQNWVDDEPDNPSSCLFQTKWDWADTGSSGKWTTKIEAYRHQRVAMYTEENPAFDTGSSVVTSKNKVRGHGRAIQFRFESNGPGKDFDLLGWAVAYSGNTAP